jgi:hypothetical protein
MAIFWKNRGKTKKNRERIKKNRFLVETEGNKNKLTIY